MATFVKFFVLMWAAVLAEGITTHSVTECSDRVILNCSITERIHVERITYYNGTDCNQAVTDLQVCDQPMTGSDTGLIPYCSGTVACVVHHNFCPGSKAVKVDYRCIPGNDVKDMCDEFIIDNTNRIFLSTPNFPFSPTFSDISPCRCSLRGSSITSIQILVLIPPPNDGTNSSLDIKYGDVTYKTESFYDLLRIYNKILSTRSTTAEITLNHNGIDYQHLWIEVQGVSIHVSCNTETNEKDFTTSSTSPTLFKTASRPPSTSSSPTSPTSSQSVSKEPNIEPPSSTDSSSTTTTTHPPQTAEITSHSQDKDPIIIILAVSLFLMMCITAIIIIIIIIVLLRRKELVWVRKPPQVERETNPYSGLDLNQRVAGNDGTYQNLNTRNSTPQYNNVSHNTHNDYYNLN